MPGTTFLYSIYGDIYLSVELMALVSNFWSLQTGSVILFLFIFKLTPYFIIVEQVNENICRVDFDEAWYRPFDDDSFKEGPYQTIDSVPDSLSKSIIRQLGKALFIEPFAIFPISYLDNELIVFEFELLGTRICARKEKE